MKLLKRIELAKVGPTQNGSKITHKMLKDIADCYGQTDLAPVILGHDSDPVEQWGRVKTDALPAFGWVKKIVKEGRSLYGDIELQQEVYDWLKRGLYSARSIGFYNASHSPTGKPCLRHLALLGGQLPAIRGLELMGQLLSDANEKPVLYQHYIFSDKESMLTEDEKNEEQPESADAQPIEPMEKAEPAEVELAEVQPADAESVPPEVTTESMEQLLRFVLTEGDNGYKGEVTTFDPVPDESNNYLYDAEAEQFAGNFIDDVNAQAFMFKVTKDGDGWISEYSPQEGADEQLDAGPEAMPVDAGATLSECGCSPEMEEPIVDKEMSIDYRALYAEAMAAKEEMAETIASLEAELSSSYERSMQEELGELYAEGLLVEAELPIAQLAKSLIPAGQTFAEANESPLFKAIKQIAKRKSLSSVPLSSNSSESFGLGQNNSMPPAGSVYSEQGMETMALIEEYCKANGLDSEKPADFNKAWAAVAQ